MEEIWKDINGYEGYYQVSNLGNVKRLSGYINSSIKNNNKVFKGEKILKPTKNDRYPCVDLSKNNVRKKHQLHRLVAKAFIPNPHNKPQVNHIDGNKHNFLVSNLEWATASEDAYHAFKNKLRPSPKKGDEDYRSKPVYQYTVCGVFLKKWGSVHNIQIETNIPKPNVRQCCQGKIKTSAGYIWSYTPLHEI